MSQPQLPPNASSLRVMPTATGHNVLLSAADYAVYHLHITRFFTEHRPEGQLECELVQRLADTEWRINRITRLEMAIYAGGQVEFAHLFAGEDANAQALLLEAHVYKTYARQLKELSIQESRLRRYFDKDLASLAELQYARHEQSPEQPIAGQLIAKAEAAEPAKPALTRPQPSTGFEFSTASTAVPALAHAAQTHMDNNGNPSRT